MPFFNRGIYVISDGVILDNEKKSKSAIAEATFEDALKIIGKKR